MTHWKDPMHIYVCNWIYLRDEITLSSDDFKTIQRLTSYNGAYNVVSNIIGSEKLLNNV